MVFSLPFRQEDWDIRADDLLGFVSEIAGEILANSFDEQLRMLHGCVKDTGVGIKQQILVLDNFLLLDKLIVIDLLIFE